MNTIKLEGYACITGKMYDMGSYDECIQPGAFRRTLAGAPDVQLVLNHSDGGTGMPLARTKSGTMRLSEDSKGLKVDADLNVDDPDVRALQMKAARGDIDGMSFAFKAEDQDWNDDYTVRTIRRVDIDRGDISCVNQPANPYASFALRSKLSLAERKSRARTVSRTVEVRGHGPLTIVGGRVRGRSVVDPSRSIRERERVFMLRHGDSRAATPWVTPTAVMLDPEYKASCVICNGRGKVTDAARSCSNCAGKGWVYKSPDAGARSRRDGERLSMLRSRA